jgi:lipopolysaccharide export system ATP-binding protein
MSKLQVDSVELEFGGRRILQDIYLDCSKGEVVGLLGRNGTGKSSLLKIIFGTLDPTHKYVSIDHKFIGKGYNNSRIAYLPQHNYLPKGIRIKSLAKMLVAPSWWDKFSEHSIYQDHFHKKTEQLSGGELRQLEMLMILYSRAGFVLLDEPFTHVTPVQADYFKTVINEIAKDKGVIITDHQYHDILSVADRVILLTNGCTKPVTGLADLATYGYINSRDPV